MNTSNLIAAVSIFISFFLGSLGLVLGCMNARAAGWTCLITAVAFNVVAITMPLLDMRRDA